MIINVKGMRADAAETAPAERYAAKAGEQETRTPYVVGAALVWLGLYLKSILPAWGQDKAPSPPRATIEDAAPPELAMAAPAAPRAPARQPEGDAPAPEPPPVDTGPSGFAPGPAAPVKSVQVEAPSLLLPWEQALPVSASRIAANDNRIAAAAPVSPAPGIGQASQPGDRLADPPAEPDEDKPVAPLPEAGNRAPRLSGPVNLGELASCAVLAIGLGQLLRHAEDPDGDLLSVQDVTASAGEVIRTETGWSYIPDPDFSGPVTLSYQIGDGAAFVTQTAHLSVFERHFLQGSDQDDNLLGSLCADDIDGRDGDDNIDAGGGNDVVRGGRGDDHVLAGAGDDTVLGGAGDDVIFGGAGDDHLWGGTGNDRLFGQAGDDILHGEAGDDLLEGGAGDDLLDGGSGHDSLYGGAGDDVLIGGAGDDLLEGGAGDDVLDDGAGVDVVRGGRGNDHIIAALDGAGDHLDGGEGRDVLDYSAASKSLHIDLEAGRASGEEIGNDTIAGFEAVVAGSGDDHVIAALDGAGSSLDGGEGTDVLDYSAAEDCLLIDLDAGLAVGVEIGTDVITGFEAVRGGSGDDHFILGDAPACLEGGGGNDLFEFLPPAPPEPGTVVETRSFEILDFKVGDRLRMSKYDLFERILDKQEDEFERIYGEDFDDDDIRIRFRHERDDEIDRTVIEADFNRDDIYETTITLEGRHLLVVVEQVVS